ncbi:UNVERIFIED_ORG: dienelactone hydrolase family protein [Shinella sp. XGS7]|nr:dienelactone hydrolase family protein [Shinella sp. XGS7]
MASGLGGGGAWRGAMAALLALGLAPGLRAQGLSGPPDHLPLNHPRLRAALDFPLAFKPGQLSVQAWRERAAPAARALMLPDGDPAQDPTPFAPQLLAEQDRGAYLAQRLSLQLDADSRVPALMLRPKGPGPFPAVLLLHDHGARFDIGKEKLIRPWDDAPREAAAQAWAQRYFSGRFLGDELAARGYLVLALDALGWSERGAAGFGREDQQALAANLFNLGSSWAGRVARDDWRAARFLASRPEVDARRVAALGFSMGAQRAWQLSALSDDVRAAVAVSWMASLPGLMVPGNNQLKGQSAYAMLHPGLARLLDYPDVAALAAPKPLLVYAGQRDALFPPAAVEPAFASLLRVWSAWGAEARLQTRWWPAGHEFNAEMQATAWDWLAEQLAQPAPGLSDPGASR